MSDPARDRRSSQPASRSKPAAADEPGQLFSLSQMRHLMRVEFSRAQRYAYPLSCLLIAVDRLGPLRDQFGYEFKESVLDGVVRALRANTRGCDYLGRLSDERFLAILPHTPEAGARLCAERLLSLVRSKGFTAGASHVMVTLSIGLAPLRSGASMFFDQLLDDAENALASAQAAGGDRCSGGAPGARAAGA